MKTYKHGGRILSYIKLFNPEKGITIRTPPAMGPGSWAGAATIFYDEELNKFYLFYRLRKPGVRGYETRIAESSDGINFKDVWSIKKKELNAESIEKSAIIKTVDGRYRLYISYEKSTDKRWHIDMLEATDPYSFSSKELIEILDPNKLNVDYVKDPIVIIVGHQYYMFYDSMRRAMLATSNDGINFRIVGEVLAPGIYWDSYHVRIVDILYIPPIFYAFYDGKSKPEENYEEKTGLAMSFDLMKFERITVKEPLMTSPYASKSVRYITVTLVDNRLYFYYEFTTQDGSHELKAYVLEVK